MLETTVLLRGILYQLMLAKEDDKGYDAMIRNVLVMCTKDDIAAVKEQLAEELASRKVKTPK